MNRTDYQTALLPVNFRTAFKEADIRGVYGDEINDVLAYRIAASFAQHFGTTTVVVARDMRTTSPAMHQAVVEAFRDMGVFVIDTGMVTTPTLYYVSGTESLPGVMITASHNPARYNGMKFVLPGAIPLTKKTGLAAMLKLVEKNNFPYAKKRGGVKKKNYIPAYTKHLFRAANLDKKAAASVAIDIGNGMAGCVTPMLKAFSNISVTELFAVPDGAFPNRESNPNLAKNQKYITEKLRSGTYDFGVAFDGDADRVAFFDEKGRHVNAAAIGALLVTHFSEKHPKSRYVYTVLTSSAYREAIISAKGVPVKAKVGHAFIKEQMRKRDVIFGCEHSAHFYYRDHFYADSGMLTLLHMLSIVSRAKCKGQTFSQLVAPYQKYFQTENEDVFVPDRDSAMSAFMEWVAGQTDVTITHFDGVTISTPQWWCVVNKDVAMPTLNVMVESPSKKIAIAKQKEIIDYLKNYPYART